MRTIFVGGALAATGGWRWSRDSLADRLGVYGVGLSTVHIGFDIGRGHQAHVMANRRQFASPVTG